MADHQIVCTECGGVNRIPEGKDATHAKCGKCKSALFTGHPADLGGAEFEKQVARNSVPVLVDVWAPWCGPCRSMAPAYEQAAQQLEPGMRVIKLNSDDNQQIAGRMGIRGIPSLILYSGGREVARTSGAMPASQIVQWARSHV
jgi:thioredoxin 2